MEAFLDLYERQSNLMLEVGHNSVADWNIFIYDKHGTTISDCGDPVIHVSGCDRNLVAAEAYVKLAEYLSEKRGGY